MLPDFKLETYFSRWEFSARFHMCASDMESMTVLELLDIAGVDRSELDSLHLGYTETYGAPQLRLSIAATYDCMEADNILAFAGAEEGIFAAMQVLLSRDDHAIVVTPNYQAAETVPLALCDVSGIALDENDNWNLDLDELRRLIRPNTKLISINFPHNPTGKVLEKAVLDELIAVAAKHGIYLFSDEAYRLLERDDSKRLPQIADIYERGLSLNVMSKAYGLPGLRIGWIATRDKDLLQRLERTKHYLSICNSAPSEYLACLALKCAGTILDRNRKLITQNLELLNGFFASRADLFDWTVPDGGCIGYPRYKGEDGVENFCTALVESAGVLLLPASVYGSALTTVPTDRFRIGYGRANTGECLTALQEFIG